MNQTNRLNKKPKYWAMSVAAVLVTAFVLVQPTMQTSYAQVSDLGVPAYFDCVWLVVDQPKDGLSMNTIKAQDVSKTIIAEKEIFKCKTVQGNIPLIIDVTTVAEIYENMTTKTIILKQAEVITCAKRDVPLGDGSVLGCDIYTPGTQIIPVNGCTDYTSQTLEHPQEMNTVNKGKTVKTIIAQKEIFRCDFIAPNTPGGGEDNDDKKIEQYIIEEIWENLNLLPNNPVLFKAVESLRCATLIETAFVESCAFKTEPVQDLDEE